MIKILALGDSYTVGQGVRVEESWPMQLAARLKEKKLVVDSLDVVARTSWAASDLLRAVAGADLDDKYDLVTLLIGVNDQVRGVSENIYSDGFEKLVAVAVKFAGGDSRRVIVISIPDYSVTRVGKEYGTDPFGKGIERFNAINKKIAESKGVRYVNVTEISRRAADDSTLVAADGLHPSAKMYSEWVKLIEPIAIEIIGSESRDEKLIQHTGED